MKMKLLFMISLFGMAFGLSAAAEPSSDFAQAAYAEIVFVQGSDLLILRSDGQFMSGEPIGAKLFAGDQVQTGAKTSVELVAMPRRSRLRLSENTVVTIGALGNDGSTTLKLLYGRLRSKVEKLAGTQTPYKVVSHTFVAGVRGTDFGCDVLVSRSGEQSSAQIYCFEGSVEVGPSAPPVGESSAKDGDAGKEGPKDKATPTEAGSFAPIVVSAGSMAVVEITSQSKKVDIVEKAIDAEIKTFWKANEFTAVQPIGIIVPAAAPDLVPSAVFDFAPIKKGIQAKNSAVAGALVFFTCGAALDVASFMMRSDNAKTADGMLCAGAVCAGMGLPLMIYSIAINPLKGTKR
jgi:hypothetical protein